jgi:hypothetical protein
MVRDVLVSHRLQSTGDVLKGLRLKFASSGWRELWSATDAEIMPQAEPGALGQHLIMPPVCSGYITCAEWPYIRRFEHFLKLLDFINDALDIHRHSIANPGLQPITNGLHRHGELKKVESEGMAAPKLTPDQIKQVSGLAADYISTQRRQYAPSATRLTSQQPAVTGFFVGASG